MATFREIDERIRALVSEDGEVLDEAAWDALQMERGAKIEGLANWVLDLSDDIEALRREKARISTLLQQTENKVARLKTFLQFVLGGEKYNGATVKIGFRHNKGIVVDHPDKLVAWAKEEGHEDILHYAEPTISKTAVKLLMDMGIDVPGVQETETVSTIIR